MNASGLEVLIGAAFGGLTSIMNGKAWVKSMRAHSYGDSSVVKRLP